MGLLLLGLAAHLGADVWPRDAFSWMDPEQYYHWAGRIASGGATLRGFPVASIYPLLLAPALAVCGSIGFALATNAIWLFFMAWGVYSLCRHIPLTIPAPVVLATMVSSPLLLGLSRELYLEFGLTALVTLTYAAWFARRRPPGRTGFDFFPVLFGLGFALKMTWPVFFVGPVLATLVRAIRTRDGRQCLWLAGAVLAPPAVVVGLFWLLNPAGFAYYMSAGNTALRSMRLLGPPDVISSASALYYPAAFGRYGLFLLAPFFLWLAVRASLPDRAVSKTDREIVGDLWLWLIVPIALLTLQVVKEPRHIAPCVVPAVLLLFKGLDRLRARATRVIVSGVVLTLAATQYALTASRAVYAPYYLNRSLNIEALKQVLFENMPGREPYVDEAGVIDVPRWLFTRSLLISGFPPNESLALVWAFRPGIVMDMENFTRPHIEYATGYEEFMELFSLAGANAYNRRCGWNGCYRTLDRDQAARGADALILFSAPGIKPSMKRDGFSCATTVPLADGSAMSVYLPARAPSESFRQTYAKTFLKENPGASDLELNTVYYALLLQQYLRTGSTALDISSAGLPAGFVPGPERRNIYFISMYTPLARRLDEALARAQKQP